MARDFIADLDAAVEGRCSCGCGAPITVASPSAWFASELCAGRWHQHAGAGRQELIELLRRAGGILRAAFEDLVTFAVDLFTGCVDAIRAAAEALDPYRDVLVDFKEPPPLPRPLDQVNPAGGLNARPLGRPAWRPVRY